MRPLSATSAWQKQARRYHLIQAARYSTAYTLYNNTYVCARARKSNHFRLARHSTAHRHADWRQLGGQGASRPAACGDGDWLGEDVRDTRALTAREQAPCRMAKVDCAAPPSSAKPLSTFVVTAHIREETVISKKQVIKKTRNALHVSSKTHKFAQN